MFLLAELLLADIDLVDEKNLAIELLEQSQLAQDAIAVSMDDLWTDVITGPLFGVVSDFGVAIAASLIGFFVLKWVRSWLSDDSISGQGDFIWAILVVVFLANEGAFLGQSTIALRNLVNGLNSQILANLDAEYSLEQVYENIQKEIVADTIAEGLLSQCQGIGDLEKQQECLVNASDNAIGVLDSVEEPTNFLQDKIGFILEAALNPQEFAKSLFQGSMSVLLKGWLMLIAVAFQWLIEIALILTALAAPLAVGATFLPVGTKSIIAWLTGFFSLGMVKIFFNIINGLVAALVFNAGQYDPLIFAFVIGVLSPILAVILASGGGLTILNSLFHAGSFLAGQGAGVIGGKSPLLRKLIGKR